jgi:hypothetical protein
MCRAPLPPRLLSAAAVPCASSSRRPRRSEPRIA